MAKLIPAGQEAEDALIEKCGVTSQQMKDKLIVLGEELEEISDKDGTIMLNLAVRLLSNVIVFIESAGGGPDILDIALRTVTSDVQRIRANNKKEAN